jgi:hypothetical protein
MSNNIKNNSQSQNGLKDLYPQNKNINSSSTTESNIIPNLNKNISKSIDNKIELEDMFQENLIGSLSTKDSKNSNAISDLKTNSDIKNINCAQSNIIPNPSNNNILLFQEEPKQEQKPNPKPLLDIPIPNQAMFQIAKTKKEMENQIEEETFNFNFESNAEKSLFLGEYTNDIYSNLLEDEKNLKIKPRRGYIEKQEDINPIMRGILINWIMEVLFQLNFKEETLFQTIWIIDTYLTLTQINRMKLQLVGIAALLISCKEYEIYYPKISHFLQITNNAYTKEELTKMENDILLKLKFNIICPTPLDFYNIVSKAFNFDERKYFLGKYFMESCLIDYNFIKYSASVIGIACAYITMKFFGDHSYKELYSNKILNEIKPKKVIKDAAREICISVNKIHNSNLQSVRNKYSLPNYLNVAQYCD